MDRIDVLTNLLVEEVARRDHDRRAGVVAQLAALTILIDAKLVSAEAAAQRLELILSVMPEPYQDEGVVQRVSLLTGWLRGHIRQDGPRWTPAVIEGGKDQGSEPDQ